MTPEARYIAALEECLKELAQPLPPWKRNEAIQKAKKLLKEQHSEEAYHHELPIE